MKDPGFKLFGKTIPTQDGESFSNDIPVSRIAEAETASASGLDTADDKETAVKQGDTAVDEASRLGNPEESQNFADGEHCKGSDCKGPKEEETAGESNEGLKNEHKETNHKGTENQDKAPKKPDKLLPCPRCDSMDTKFCYYNNYNVNQPRHFCKNCQRYWTAGGTMRNVPVGAGRRKNKNSTSHYRHMVMSEGITANRADASDASLPKVIPASIASSARVLNGSNIHLLPLDVDSGGGGARVLNFGPDAPLRESMATALGLADQTTLARKILKVKEEEKGSENRDDQSCGSSTTASTSTEKEGGSKSFEAVTMKHDQAGVGAGVAVTAWPNPNGISISSQQQQQFYGACPWLYGWNVGWAGCPPASAAASQVYLNGMAHATPTPIHKANSGTGMGMWAAAAAGIPWPFIPAAYWPGPTGWGGGAWNMPFSSLAASSTPSSGSGNSGSSTLGKHSRDTSQSEEKQDGCLWVPKTLRIDDPDEASKSSIWTTLGIANKSESIRSGGIFKAFQQKTGEDDSLKTSPQGLLANPAAFSRSMAFQEST
eukprot:TRINITY_DN31174_c0_g1_i1.p1 TRINITY_DN31174_c0_g1~~TRINITY_DN31174_c0_g1_i1.p1  ORF type:complete len:544 (-),score=98.83 TRINITY_DN31174_c0_g1_i1:208-1839(-)